LAPAPMLRRVDDRLLRRIRINVSPGVTIYGLSMLSMVTYVREH
jgi:hypothetical protein